MLNRIAAASEQFQGSLPRLRRDKSAWDRLLHGIGKTIEIMPLWKLQTVGADKLSFRDRVGPVRPPSAPESRPPRRGTRRARVSVRIRPFGAHRRAGSPARGRGEPLLRYPLDLGHNFVLADVRCNGGKLDRLASFEHLERWCARNAGPRWTPALAARMLPHDVRRTMRVAGWAYAQAESGGATVWQRGRDGLVGLDPRWRNVLRP